MSRSHQEFEIERENGQHHIVAAATILDLGAGQKEVEDLDWSAEDWNGNDVSEFYSDQDIADLIYDQIEQDEKEAS